MAKQKVEFELEVPEGWELTGEYRHANPGEHWLTSDGAVFCLGTETTNRWPIVRRSTKWRPVKREDLKRVWDGEEVKARFRDSEKEKWDECFLTGWSATGDYAYESCGDWFLFCEVLEVSE